MKTLSQSLIASLLIGVTAVALPMAASAKGGDSTPRYTTEYNNKYKVNANGFMEPGTVGNAAATGSEAERASGMQPSAGGYNNNTNTGYNNNRWNNDRSSNSSRDSYSGSQSNTRRSY